MERDKSVPMDIVYGPFWRMYCSGPVSQPPGEKNPCRYSIDYQSIDRTFSTTFVIDDEKDAIELIRLLNKYDSRAYNQKLCNCGIHPVTEHHKNCNVNKTPMQMEMSTEYKEATKT